MKNKPKKQKNVGLSSERLAELRRATLIASTRSSLRLSGSKVINEQVEQILDAMTNKSSVQK